MQKDVYIKVYKDEFISSSSLTFDGGNDYISLPNLGFAGNTSITVEAWVYPITYPVGVNVQQTIFAFSTQNNNQAFIVEILPGGTVRIATWFDDLVTSQTIPLNRWTHITAIYNQSLQRLECYINGLLVTTKAVNAPNFINQNYRIGCRVGLDSFFNGSIANVRIWNVVRNADQIINNLNKETLLTSPGLVALYRINEGVGTTAVELKSANNGTLINFPTNPWSTTRTPPIMRTIYKGFFADFSVSSFNKSISSGPGELTIQIPRKFDDFGENDLISFNNNVQVWVYDNDTPEGKLVYTGYIAEYSPKAGSEETIEVRALGYVTKLSLDIAMNFTSYVLNYSNQDPSNIIKSLIDNFRAQNQTSAIKYTSSSIQNTGKSVTQKFSSVTYMSAIDSVRKLADSNWYLYFDVDNTLYFRPIPVSATHRFMFERDVVNIEMTKSIIEMRNGLLFWNGLVSTDSSYIAKNYVNSSSQIQYGRQVETKKDERYKNAASADAFGARYINTFSQPINTVTFTVIDNALHLGYDIESINPGDTCKILNIAPNNALTDNMLIMAVNYDVNAGTAKITVADVKAYLQRTMYDLSEESKTEAYTDPGPSTYS